MELPPTEQLYWGKDAGHDAHGKVMVRVMEPLDDEYDNVGDVILCW